MINPQWPSIRSINTSQLKMFMKKLVTIGVTFRTGIISVIYKFKLQQFRL